MQNGLANVVASAVKIAIRSLLKTKKGHVRESAWWTRLRYALFIAIDLTDAGIILTKGVDVRIQIIKRYTGKRNKRNG